MLKIEKLSEHTIYSSLTFELVKCVLLITGAVNKFGSKTYGKEGNIFLEIK